jgi:uncharacterized protein YbbC (DUF1343 family)
MAVWLILPVFVLMIGFQPDTRVRAGDFQPGIEILVRHYAQELKGKRVGILTNPTGVDRNLRSSIDIIRSLPGVKVVRLFSPEHGIRGSYHAGEKVDENLDKLTSLPIVSLYGKFRKPPSTSLENLDVVVYDIQDIGSRSYTFISTMTYMMEACERAGVSFLVLDRPCPMGGDRVGGPMIEDQFISFIGIHNVPQVYGLTPGEWARLVKAERTPDVRLAVIPMKGWHRGDLFGDLDFPWVPTSEHIPHWETAFFYAMTGPLGELGKVNNGVGTPSPFELVGAPWIDADKFTMAMKKHGLEGVKFRSTSFRPRYGAHKGELCHGFQVHLAGPGKCDPARVGLKILETLNKLYPGKHLFKTTGKNAYRMFQKSIGESRLLDQLGAARNLDAYWPAHDRSLLDYKKRRNAVLIYE